MGKFMVLNGSIELKEDCILDSELDVLDKWETIVAYLKEHPKERVNSAKYCYFYKKDPCSVFSQNTCPIALELHGCTMAGWIDYINLPQAETFLANIKTLSCFQEVNKK